MVGGFLFFIFFIFIIYYFLFLIKKQKFMAEVIDVLTRAIIGEVLFILFRS